MWRDAWKILRCSSWLMKANTTTQGCLLSRLTHEYSSSRSRQALAPHFLDIFLEVGLIACVYISCFFSVSHGVGLRSLVFLKPYSCSKHWYDKNWTKIWGVPCCKKWIPLILSPSFLFKISAINLFFVHLLCCCCIYYWDCRRKLVREEIKITRESS